jgi:hypothetical protein
VKLAVSMRLLALLVAGGCVVGDVTGGPRPGGGGDGDGDVSGADGGATGGDPTTSPACAEAVQHSDLAWIQANVFTTGCAGFASCHQGGASAAGGLDLSDGMSQAALVGVASQTGGGMNLVEAGSPSDSYLMVTLGHYGADDPRLDPTVGTMPPNSELLCVEKREAVARWIESL